MAEKEEISRQARNDISTKVEVTENLVKKTCRELGITQKELAEIMGVTPHTITNWVKGKLDKTVIVALEGLIYKEKFVNFQKTIKEFNNFTLNN